MHTKTLKDEIIVHALTSKLWKVLTASEYTDQFLFDGELVSDWVNEGPILLEVNSSGKKEVVKKGKIQEIVPGISLRFTLFEHGEFSNEPVSFHFELIPGQDGIRLILNQEVQFLSDDLYRIMASNNKMMLQKIKWLAEYS